jgi:hypothetical protein
VSIYTWEELGLLVKILDDARAYDKTLRMFKNHSSFDKEFSLLKSMSADEAICRVLSDRLNEDALWERFQLFFETPIEDMPLLINETGLPKYVSIWRLQIAK